MTTPKKIEQKKEKKKKKKKKKNLGCLSAVLQGYEWRSSDYSAPLCGEFTIPCHLINFFLENEASRSRRRRRRRCDGGLQNVFIACAVFFDFCFCFCFVTCLLQVEDGCGALDEYFEGYVRPSVHRTMLSDAPRMRSFLRAVQQLSLAGKTVLDVGCGTGLLACWCARHGAARVVAVEVPPSTLFFILFFFFFFFDLCL